MPLLQPDHTRRAVLRCGHESSRVRTREEPSQGRHAGAARTGRVQRRGSQTSGDVPTDRLHAFRWLLSCAPLTFGLRLCVRLAIFFRAQPHVGLALVSCSCVWAAHGGSCDARSRIDCQSRAWSPNGPRSRDARSPDARGTRVRGPCVASLGRVWTPLVRARCSVNSTQWTRQNVDAKR